MVYAGVRMARTNIDIDAELIERVMKRNRFRTKREAVNYALRRLDRPAPMSLEEARAMEGIGWEGDLDAMRRGDPVEEF
jgi:Arc/MetJ family transcription regulator